MQIRKLLLKYVLALAMCSAIFTEMVTAQCSFSAAPPGEVCSSAYYICGSDLNGFTGRLPDNLSVNDQFPQLCFKGGSFDNIIWFSFTPTQNTVTLKITPSNCTVVNGFSGMQAGLYSACRESASLDCEGIGSNGLTTEFILSSNSFTPCEPAFLFLDGYAQSVCDFTIEVIEGIDVVVVNPPDFSILQPGFITGENIIECNQKNIPFRYSLTPPECIFNSNPLCGAPPTLPNDVLCYEWNISPDTGAFFMGNSFTGSFTDIVFTQPGDYTISAETFIHPFYGGSCGAGGCGRIIEWNVKVKGQDTIILNPINLCPGDSIEICGAFISTDTIVVCPSADGCSISYQTITVGENQPNLMGTQYICQGDFFRFQGKDYFITGDYEDIDVNDCTIRHLFRVETVSLSSQILPGVTTLDCNNPMITLEGNINTAFPGNVEIKWENELREEISPQTLFSTNQSGNFYFTARLRIGNAECYSESSIEINEDFEKPSINIFKPLFNCNNNSGIVTLNSDKNLFDTEWTLPLGNVVYDQNLFVDSLNVFSDGLYYFKAKAANGCAVDTFFRMETNFSKPNLEIIGEDLTCFKPVSLLRFNSDIAYDSVRWTNGANFLTAFDTYNATIEATYNLEVRAAASKCWNNDSKFVADLKIRPQVEVGPDLVWHCNTTELNVTPVVSAGPEFRYRWQTNNGQISSTPSEAELKLLGVGTYVLEVLNTENGCNNNDVFSVNRETNIPTELITAQYDPLCPDEANGVISIQFTEGGFGPYNYFFEGKLSQRTEIENLSRGNYTIEVEDANGCRLSRQLVLQDPDGLEVSLPPTMRLAYSDRLTLIFESNYPDEDIESIVWKNEENEILGTDFDLDYDVFKSHEIIVEIQTIYGCNATARTKIIVDTELELFYPNIFSPNGDGVNDHFVIYKNLIPANVDMISIYDRFGNRVYHETDFAFNDDSAGWDGKFNNKFVEQGIYILVIQITDFFGTQKIIKKDLTILR